MTKLITSNSVRILCEEILKRSPDESDYFPIDRRFLEPYLARINQEDEREFIYFNLENATRGYAIQLLVCLPEVWERADMDDIEEILASLTRTFGYFILVEFSYKYLEIDILPLILNYAKNSGKHAEISDYLRRQWNILIKSEEEQDELEHGHEAEAFGYERDRWIYIKQKLLVDDRARPAVYNYEYISQYFT